MLFPIYTLLFLFYRCWVPVIVSSRERARHRRFFLLFFFCLRLPCYAITTTAHPRWALYFDGGLRITTKILAFMVLCFGGAQRGEGGPKKAAGFCFDSFPDLKSQGYPFLYINLQIIRNNATFSSASPCLLLWVQGP